MGNVIATMDELNLLVTGAGAPGIRGTIFCLKNNDDNVRVNITTIDIQKDPVGKYFSDYFYQVPAPEEEGYFECIKKICIDRNIKAILPQTTREIAYYSANKHKFEILGVNVLVASKEAIEISNDKFGTTSLFREIGLVYPEFNLAKNREELVNFVKKLGYPHKPVVVKLPVSNGMRGIRILKEKAWDLNRFINEKPSGVECSLDDLLKIIEIGDRWPELLVCEYLPGQEYSVDAFVGKNIQIALTRSRDVIRSGISFKNTIIKHPEIEEMTLKAAKAMSLTGVFGFQYKLDYDGNPKILECNPRIQGTMVSSYFAGANIIWMGVKELLGQAVINDDFEIKSGKFIRYWGGVGISEKEHQEI